jgi:hypothetical protein
MNDERRKIEREDEGKKGKKRHIGFLLHEYV